MVLMGSEIKAIRDGKLNLSDSYARVDGKEVFLGNCHISEYKNASFGHAPLRKRKLLLHRKEIRKLQKRVAEPDEIIGSVLYLASDASSFTTGTDLIAAGGMR